MVSHSRVLLSRPRIGHSSVVALSCLLASRAHPTLAHVFLECLRLQLGQVLVIRLLFATNYFSDLVLYARVPFVPYHYRRLLLILNVEAQVQALLAFLILCLR